MVLAQGSVIVFLTWFINYVKRYEKNDLSFKSVGDGFAEWWEFDLLTTIPSVLNSWNESHPNRFIGRSSFFETNESEGFPNSRHLGFSKFSKETTRTDSNVIKPVQKCLNCLKI